MTTGLGNYEGSPDAGSAPFARIKCAFVNNYIYPIIIMSDQLMMILSLQLT
jgi:hypothetical protein